MRLREDEAIVLPLELRDRLLAAIERRLPTKSFGFLLSKGEARQPEDFILFETNVRNSVEWKGRFESYGQYFLEHDDAGFVATPEESWKVQKEMWARGMVAIGVFHSHLRHPANFSLIDYEMHVAGFRELWHMIVSVRNPKQVQVRVFATEGTGVRELPVMPVVAPRLGGGEAVCEARRVLALDAAGRPVSTDRRAIFLTIQRLIEAQDEGAIEELLVHGFLKGREARYQEYVGPLMQALAGAEFEMGTDDERCEHFVGESPVHRVMLSSFSIATVPVTNEMFGLFDRRWADVAVEDRHNAATEVSWYDAVVFAMWMGCRLPTEAEWEYACGAGSKGEWGCGDEEMLERYAWYSRNAHGEAHQVGMLEPNSFGLFDLHGNVWEWCWDGYDQDGYERSQGLNPRGSGVADGERVCRGGSFHALSEMCRTRYRLHEPAEFAAMDLGFRLVKSVANDFLEVTGWSS